MVTNEAPAVPDYLKPKKEAGTPLDFLSNYVLPLAAGYANVKSGGRPNYITETYKMKTQIDKNTLDRESKSLDAQIEVAKEQRDLEKEQRDKNKYQFEYGDGKQPGTKLIDAARDAEKWALDQRIKKMEITQKALQIQVAQTNLARELKDLERVKAGRPMSNDQVEKVTDYDNTVQAMSDSLDMLKKYKFPTGVVAGNISPTIAQYMPQYGPKFGTFFTKLEDAFQKYRKVTTGAQASDRELQMLRPIIPNRNDTYDTFVDKAEAFIKWKKLERDTYLRNTGLAGFDVTGFQKAKAAQDQNKLPSLKDFMK
ncbi:MAG TPA: hypothetical protein P5110_07550 [Candidatus Omnitrophota bacterium]|nr:hypothetical protein [Candidatus Omnitrophota bacterium]